MGESILRNLPGFVFGATLIPIGIIHFRAQWAFRQATRELEKEYAKIGVRWEFAGDVRSKIALFNYNSKWIDPEESSSIQEAKRRVMRQREAIGKSLKPMVKIMLIGFALSAVTAMFTQK